MSQKSIELILFRQITSYLNTAAFIIDASEKIIFCNAAAEKFIHFQFSEAEEITVEDWSKVFLIQNTNGENINLKESSIYSSFQEQKLTQGMYNLKPANGEIKQIQVCTIPIISHLNHFYGVVVFFEDNVARRIISVY